ncbi:MAG: hypothetical protein ACI9Y1_002052 [Lentisphaeria bacterium]|jgi:hypothetical protein
MAKKRLTVFIERAGGNAKVLSVHVYSSYWVLSLWNVARWVARSAECCAVFSANDRVAMLPKRRVCSFNTNSTILSFGAAIFS